MTITNEVILVNEKDEQTGTMEKIEAHRKALLHRAFSVFIFNNKGEMLLQQRAFNKYHSGGLWTNACCGHPSPGEQTAEAARRRLMEEMGFTTALEELFDLTYQHAFENGLTEHEYDHVFAGTWDATIAPTKEEVNDYCYKSLEDIAQSMEMRPQLYTVWFRLIFLKVEAWARKTA
jgi:isopentenyl-diphosphate delta-isomerase